MCIGPSCLCDWPLVYTCAALHDPYDFYQRQLRQLRMAKAKHSCTTADVGGSFGGDSYVAVALATRLYRSLLAKRLVKCK